MPFNKFSNSLLVCWHTTHSLGVKFLAEQSSIFSSQVELVAHVVFKFIPSLGK